MSASKPRRRRLPGFSCAASQFDGSATPRGSIVEGSQLVELPVRVGSVIGGVVVDDHKVPAALGLPRLAVHDERIDQRRSPSNRWITSRQP
jgi:hypothetical protein